MEAIFNIKEAAEDDKQEIGDLAVWTVSTAKPGNGVDHLRDGDLETYWQSDGQQPHLINIQFYKKVRVQEISIYIDYKRDESYTPNKLSIRAGSDYHDLEEIRPVDIEEPVGWLAIKLSEGASRPYVRGFLFQIAVISNHQNGRDTHIRQIRVYSAPSTNRGVLKTGGPAQSMLFETIR